MNLRMWIGRMKEFMATALLVFVLLGAATVQAAGMPPTATGLSPGAGPLGGGNIVLISGTGFSGVTAVDFGGIPATNYVVISTTQITAIAPAGSGNVDVTVSSTDGISTGSGASAYAYLSPPTVTGLSPSFGLPGTSIAINGSNFTGVTSVNLGSVPAAYFSVVSPTEISVQVPTGSGVVDVTVVNPAGTSTLSSADRFSYGSAATLPTVTAVTPNAGPPGGFSVIISGTNLSGAIGVMFGTVPAAGFTVNSPTMVTATAPTGTGTVDVTVTTSVGTSAVTVADQFSYLTVPIVSSLSQTAGPLVPSTVTIVGANFTGVLAVKFGSTVAPGFTVNSANQMTVTAPVGSGTVDVTVVALAGVSPTSFADQYTYMPVPTVTGISPTGGPAGATSVMVTGSGFHGATAANTTVNFGSVPATNLTVLSDTQLTVMAPGGSGTVYVRVTSPGGTSAIVAGDQFAYAYLPLPTVTSLSPGSGPATGGTNVTISGYNFTGATAVAFGSLPATTFNIVSATQMTALSPAGTGTVNVMVSNSQGTSGTSTADLFSYAALGIRVVSGGNGNVVVVPSTQATPPGATVIDPPAIIPAGGSSQAPLTAAFTIPSGTIVDNSLLVYYYDALLKAWIALPTKIVGNQAQASVPPGVPVALLRWSVHQPPDSLNHWADGSILKAMSLGVMSGFPNGNFQPDGNVTRYQMAKVLASALGLDVSAADSHLGAFADAKAIPAWAAPSVGAVVAAGLMVGINGFFDGDATVTRAQMATVLGRRFGGAPSATVFADVASVPAWAATGVAQSVANGFFSGFPDGTFRPNDPLTRGQMAVVISLVLNKLAGGQ